MVLFAVVVVLVVVVVILLVAVIVFFFFIIAVAFINTVVAIRFVIDVAIRVDIILTPSFLY